MIRKSGDIDIDLGSRNELLKLIRHTPASMLNVNPIRRHGSGVYITEVPYDPINNMASIDYAEAEDRGYFKLDLLNVYVYRLVRNEMHLVELMQEPDWSMLDDINVVQNLVHLSNYFHTIKSMPEPVDSIPRLAMLLAIIRPSKKHLVGKPWKEVAETVWDKDEGQYVFRKAHAIAYAQLVVVHLNLIKEHGLENLKKLIEIS
jgi:hypothetical protein